MGKNQTPAGELTDEQIMEMWGGAQDGGLTVATPPSVVFARAIIDIDRVFRSGAVRPGFVLVPEADLKQLCDSIGGDCYMGQDWERKAIKSMLSGATKS